MHVTIKLVRAIPLKIALLTRLGECPKIAAT